MALIKCNECSNEVSSLAATCPKCGAPIKSVAPITPEKNLKRETRPAAKVAGIVLLILAAIAFFIPKKEAERPRPQAAAAISLAKPPEMTAAEKAKKAQEDERDKRIMTSALYIKHRLRDPDSLVWEYFLSNETGDLLCIGYRAKNGFGGMNREHAVVVGTKISTVAANVKKYCNAASGLEDVKPIVEAYLPYL
jgi:uncharacterized OB-fold protein